MNKENILKVADAIEQHSIPTLGFNMNWWGYTFDPTKPENQKHDKSGHNCGTVACIGGWTETLFKTTDARSALELPTSVATQLFYPDQNGAPQAYEATPVHAVRVLRHLAETGKVDWARAMDAEALSQRTEEAGE